MIIFLVKQLFMGTGHLYINILLYFKINVGECWWCSIGFNLVGKGTGGLEQMHIQIS